MTDAKTETILIVGGVRTFGQVRPADPQEDATVEAVRLHNERVGRYGMVEAARMEAEDAGTVADGVTARQPA